MKRTKIVAAFQEGFEPDGTPFLLGRFCGHEVRIRRVVRPWQIRWEMEEVQKIKPPDSSHKANQTRMLEGGCIVIQPPRSRYRPEIPHPDMFPDTATRHNAKRRKK